MRVPGGRGVPRTPGAGSRAGTAWRGERPSGQEARRVGGGLVKFAPCASWTGTSCLCFPGGGGAGSPAARRPDRRSASSCADPRAPGNAPCRPLPSAAAPRALPPLPGSRRSETGAGPRPQSDGAAGPIARGSGALGGGAEAGRGPGGVGSLREALPRGGPAGGRRGGPGSPEARGRRERRWGASADPRRTPVEPGGGRGSRSASCAGLGPG